MASHAGTSADESGNVAGPGSSKSLREMDDSVEINVGRSNQNNVCGDIYALVNRMCNESPSSTLDLPESVEVFLGMMESLIGKYDCGEGEGKAKLENADEEAMEFFGALECLSRFTDALGGCLAHSTEMTAALNRGNCAKQRAMTFLEDEFRVLLEQSKKSDSFFKHQSHESDRCVLPEPNGGGTGEEEFPGYPPTAVTSMNRIAHAMILSGCRNECSQIYGATRRRSFKEAMCKLGFQGISHDDLQRMPWESLEGEVNTWIRVVKKSATVHFPGERSLCDAVFSNYTYMWNELFSPLIQTVGIKLLDFAGAVAVTKRSPEKLFKFIDMYETIRDNLPTITSHFDPCESAKELKKETSSVLRRIGEVIINIFIELENSIKSDIGKQPVPSGTVHPLTRYTINYLGYAQQKRPQCQLRSSIIPIPKTNSHNAGTTRRQPQREIQPQMMGEPWRRKRSSELRQYHKSFNAMFDEIHRTQSTWVVSDVQLQSELRISVSSVVVPAYRSFLGRFGQYLDSGRQTEKYLKYQSDDIQTLIDELFDGNPNSMARRR